MAIYGGPNQTPFDLSGSSLWGQQNELIAWKPQWITDDTNDWWKGISSPEAFDVNRSAGLLFYDRRAGLNSTGLLTWVGESASGKTDLTYAAPANRPVNIVGLWTFNPTKRTPDDADGNLAPFILGSNSIESLANRLANWVRYLNSDRLDGFDAIQSAGTAAPPADFIQVSRTGGRLTVGDAVDQYDAVNYKTLQAFIGGISTKTACQWATVAPLAVNVSGGNTLTSTANGEFNPDPDVRPGIGKPVASTTEANAHRVLVKNQWTTGAADSAAIPNGIYYLHTAGSVTTPYVLVRTSDANQDGELARGNLVFVENGTANARSQWQLVDTAPGGSTSYGPAINPGVEPNWWTLYFQSAANVPGNGIVFDGLTIHFGQKEAYTPGSLWTSNTGSTVAQIVPPTAHKFLSHSGVGGTLPIWDDVDWDDVTGKPITFQPSPHTHYPTDILTDDAQDPGAVAYFTEGTAGMHLDGALDKLSFSAVNNRFSIGSSGVGVQMFYHAPVEQAAATYVLSWDTTSHEVGRRTVASITSGFWPVQSGTAFNHVRWGSPATDTLVNAFLKDVDSAQQSVQPVTASVIDLGATANQFATVYAGAANLGILNLASEAGTTPAVLLGCDAAVSSTRQRVKAYTSLPAAAVQLAQNAVGFGSAGATLSGDSTKLFFNGSQLRILNGTKAAPALSFIADTAAGIYRPEANSLAVAVNNVEALKLGDVQSLIGTHFGPAIAARQLGNNSNAWGELHLDRTTGTAPITGLAGWGSAAGNSKRVESLDASQVKSFLGVTDAPIGTGLKDYFTMWGEAGALTSAPMRVDNVRYLNESLRHFSPNPTDTYDLGYGGATEPNFGTNLLTGNNTDFTSGLGSWVAHGAVISLAMDNGRMRVSVLANGINTGVQLPLGALILEAGSRYRFQWRARMEQVPAEPARWKAADFAGNIAWESGVEFFATSTDTTFELIGTASVASDCMLGFVRSVNGSQGNDISFDLVAVQKITNSAGAARRWRKLWVKDIDAAGLASVATAIVNGAGTGGTNTAPILALYQANTGFYAASAGQIDVTANATRIATFTATGLGLGMFVPTALLELGAGTATRPPARFAASGNALLTTPLAGSIESDNSRLYFSNTIAGVTARHPLAHYDDLDFTNDPNAEMSGAANFTGGVSATMASSTLDGLVIGTGDFSGWVRFRVPPVAVSFSCGVWNLTSSTSGSTGPYDFGGNIEAATLNLTVVIRDAGGSYGAGSRYVLPLAGYAGRIVDVVVTRTAGAILVYLNGFNQGISRLSGSASIDAGPIANGAATLRFNVGNMSSGSAPLNDRFYRAAIFTRALTAAQVADLTRHGPDERDKWALSRNLLLAGDFSDAAKWLIGPAGTTAIAGGVLTINNTSGSTQGVLQSATQNPTMFTGADLVAAGGYFNKRFRLSETVSGVSGAITMAMGAGGTVSANLINGVNNFEAVWAVASTAAYAANSAASAQAVIDNVSLTKIGCLLDLDFGIVIGTQVMDWSGRFHGALTGTYEIVRPIRTVTVPNGGGTLTVGLRKYAEKVSVLDDQTKTITHNLALNTTAPLTGYELMVGAWDITSKHQLSVGVVRKTDNTVDVTFNKIGAPSVAKDVVVVVTA